MVHDDARRRRSRRLKPRISPAEAVEGPRVPHTVLVQAEAGKEREDAQPVDSRREKLADDASGKYRVGTAISAMR
jgi:hypothetical protein